MIKIYLSIFIKTIIFFLLTVITVNSQNASEILIYADNISYDDNENLIAKGKAKKEAQCRLLSGR